MTGEETDPATSFDARAFLKKLEQARAEKLEVVARRPKQKRLVKALLRSSEILYALTDTHRKIAALEGGADPVQTYEWFPKPGSVAFDDRIRIEPGVTAFIESESPKQLIWLDTNPTRNSTAWAVDFIRRCLHSTVDDLSAVAVLSRHSGHIRAPITLSRSVLEAAALACFLSDPDATPEERLRRTLNLRFSELKEASNEVRDRADEFDYDAEILELVSYANVIGFAVKASKPGSHQPPMILGPGTTRADSARLMVDAVLPDGLGRSMWRSLSAVAHSRDSGTVLPDEYGLPHEIEGWRRFEAVAWHAVPALLVVHEMVRRLQTFLGWDFADWLEMFENVVHVWSIGGGLADDQIREGLGFEQIIWTP